MINSIAIEEIRAAAAAALPEVAPIIAAVGAAPELGFEEKKACALQVEYLKKHNYNRNIFLKQLKRKNFIIKDKALLFF